MTVYLHADDLGLTRGMNRHILECHDRGALHSASIIANGYAVEEALEAWENRGRFPLSVHLNFIEGTALAPEAIPFLVDKTGRFHRSYMELYRLSNRSCGLERGSVVEAIKTEMLAQVQRIYRHMPAGTPLRIDSHQHVHMLPLFFEALMLLHQELPIAYLRIPRERYFIGAPPLLQKTLGPNLLKVKFLNHLCQLNAGKLHADIRTNDFFIGVLFTGRMTPAAAQACWKRIAPSVKPGSVIEILYHPGQADAEEEHYWNAYPSLKKYYRSPARLSEKEAMASDETMRWLRSISPQVF